MNMSELALCMEEPMQTLEAYMNRARYTMQDLQEDFFDSTDLQSGCKDRETLLAAEFERGAVRADIVEDAIQHMRGALAQLSALAKRIEGAA